MNAPELDQDIDYLITTAQDAIRVLRGNMTYFEAHGRSAQAEVEAIRWLSLAIQLVRHDRAPPAEAVAHLDCDD